MCNNSKAIPVEILSDFSLSLGKMSSFWMHRIYIYICPSSFLKILTMQWHKCEFTWKDFKLFSSLTHITRTQNKHNTMLPRRDDIFQEKPHSHERKRDDVVELFISRNKSSPLGTFALTSVLGSNSNLQYWSILRLMIS